MQCRGVCVKESRWPGRLAPLPSLLCPGSSSSSGRESARARRDVLCRGRRSPGVFLYLKPMCRRGGATRWGGTLLMSHACSLPRTPPAHPPARPPRAPGSPPPAHSSPTRRRTARSSSAATPRAPPSHPPPPTPRGRSSCSRPRWSRSRRQSHRWVGKRAGTGRRVPAWVRYLESLGSLWIWRILST